MIRLHTYGLNDFEVYNYYWPYYMYIQPLRLKEVQLGEYFPTHLKAQPTNTTGFELSDD